MTVFRFTLLVQKIYFHFSGCDQSLKEEEEQNTQLEALRLENVPKDRSTFSPGERRKRAFTICSYKEDPNPKAVEHLAQALGLE